MTINYQGQEEEEDDDNNDENDDNEDNDTESKPITFGKNSFLNFKLLAPNATVKIGKRSTMRGQIIANKIKVGKATILSRDTAFVKESDPTKVVEDDDGALFVVNEVIILMEDNATLNDMQSIADSIGGRVIGFLPILKMSKIEVETNTLDEQDQIINQLNVLGSPFIAEVLPNFIFQ